MDDTTEQTAPSTPTLAEEVNKLTGSGKVVDSVATEHKADPEALKKAADSAVRMRKRACRLNIAVELRGVNYSAGKDLVLKNYQVEYYKDNVIEIDGMSVDPEKAEAIEIVANELNE